MKDLGEYSAVQTIGLQAIDSGCNNTIFEESDDPKKGEESKFEKEVNERKDESDNPLEPLEHTHFNKARKKELCPESNNSSYRIES